MERGERVREGRPTTGGEKGKRRGVGGWRLGKEKEEGARVFAFTFERVLFSFYLFIHYNIDF